MHCGEVCHTGALEGGGGKKQGRLWPASSPVRGRLWQPRNWMRMMHVEELCVHGVCGVNAEKSRRLAWFAD